VQNSQVQEKKGQETKHNLFRAKEIILSNVKVLPIMATQCRKMVRVVG